MTSARLAEREIERTDWASYRQLGGDAGDTGPALADLLASAGPEESSAPYWRLENHVVAQGTVYGAAEPAMAVAMAALADPRPPWVRIQLLNLVFQVIDGGPAPGEAPDLVERCVRRVREGYWLLVREEAVGVGDAATDVLEVLQNMK